MKELRLDEIDGLDISGEILPQLTQLKKCNKLDIKYKDFTISFPNIEEFKKMFELTETPCYCCGRALYRIRGCDYLECMGGPIIAKPCIEIDKPDCSHNRKCKGNKNE